MPLVAGGALDQPVRLANRVMSLREHKRAWEFFKRYEEQPADAEVTEAQQRQFQEVVDYLSPVIAIWKREEDARREAAARRALSEREDGHP